MALTDYQHLGINLGSAVGVTFADGSVRVLGDSGGPS
jgi:hypothetical protein